MKIVCLSFDDGTIYDVKFIELLNKYKLKATLNLNSGLNDFVWFYGDKPIKRLNLSEIKCLYDGHEVCSHSLNHPYFSTLSKEDVIKEVEEDIHKLSLIFDRKICGFAFPFHDQTEQNILDIKENIKCLNYIRYSYLDYSGIHKDKYHIHINALYDDPTIYDRLEEFINSSKEHNLFVIAGHSYEFEVKNDWSKIEDLIKFLSQNDKIQVLTMDEAIKLIFN